MYSDLFDALGGGSHNASSSTAIPEDKPVVSFKAGKMDLTLQENGNYWAIPDTRRGQVNLKYNDDDQLVWEWFDRREKTVVDTIRVTHPSKLERAVLPTATKKSSESDKPNEKVFYWKLENEWKMVWLQDKEEEEGLIDKVNEVLKNPTKPPEASATDPLSSTVRSPGNASTGTSSSNNTAGQVDALSNILGNLGLPQGDTLNPTSGSATTSSSNAAGSAAQGGGTLTLADLQGVMAGLQQQQEQQVSPPGLQDIVSPEARTGYCKNSPKSNARWNIWKRI
jgi:hypothetical protein